VLAGKNTIMKRVWVVILVLLAIPLEKANYVFTLPYADSLRVGVAVGSQPDSLAFPLRGKVVTVFADAAKGTVLSLVTWTLQDDARWFGGAIPQMVQTVEQVRIGADGKPEYVAFAGAAPSKKDVAADVAEQRVRYILDKKAAVMP
jgi:hypothetical protein